MDRFPVSAGASFEAGRKCTERACALRLPGMIVLLAWSLSVSAAAAPTRETLESQGVRRSYYLFVPQAASSAEPAPLLMLLHGSGQTGLALLRQWTELAAGEGVILVAPNARDRTYWRLDDDSPEFLRDVIDAAASRHAVDRRRVYLFGLSGGAVYALTLSMLESEYFAATAVFAGVWRDDESLGLVAHARRRIPVSIFIGDRDEYFPPNWVRATEESLKESGHPVTLTILERRGHSYAGVARRVNREAWNFLADVRLEAEPIFETYGLNHRLGLRTAIK